MSHLKAKQITLTAKGDLIVGGTGGVSTILPIGSNDQVLTVDNGNIVWKTNSGGGASALADLTDMNINSLQHGQLLAYSTSINKWVNFTPSYISSINARFTGNTFTGTAGALEIGYDATNNNSVIQSYNRSGTPAYTHLKFLASYYTFNAAGADRFTIGGNGNVQFLGNNLVYSSSGGTGVRSGISLDGTNNKFSIYTNTTEKFVIDGNGNTGIGKTPTNFKLEVSGSGTTSSGIGIADSAGALRTYHYGTSTYSAIGTSNALPLLFEIASSEVARISGTGNFGIGANSPDRKLVVNGEIGFSYTATASYNGIKRNGVSTEYFNTITSTATDIIHRFTGYDGGVKMTINQEGRVGIGTSTSTNSTISLDIVKGSDRGLDTAIHLGSSRIHSVCTPSGTYNGLAFFTNIDDQNAFVETDYPSWMLDLGGRNRDGNQTDMFIIGRRLSTDTTWGTFFKINNIGNIGLGTLTPVFTSGGKGIVVTSNIDSNLMLDNSTKTNGRKFTLVSATNTNGGFFAINDSTDNVDRFVINNSGNVGINTTNNLTYKFNIDTGAGTSTSKSAMSVIMNGTEVFAIGQETIAIVSAVGGTSNASIVRVGRTGANRSIAATGTINANGADFAEYFYKASTVGTIAPGDVCGIDSDGNLTDVFDDAYTFVIKSTEPAVVGNDVWVYNVGPEVKEPIKPIAPVELEGEALDDLDKIDEYNQLYSQYELDMIEYNQALDEYNDYLDLCEAERQKVDRIALSGQVPVNFIGANVGDYLVPVKNVDGSIGIETKSEDTITFAEYKNAVGKVVKILDDGRAWVLVKIG